MVENKNVAYSRNEARKNMQAIEILREAESLGALEEVT